MNVFFDSSAWAKRYIEESGSGQVEEISLKADAVTLCILCVPEIISAFSRLRRENKLSEDQFIQLKNVFLTEIRDIEMINITSGVIAQSVDLLQNYPSRTLDALHIACARTGEIDLFVTSDRRQMDAAEASGLTACYI